MISVLLATAVLVLTGAAIALALPPRRRSMPALLGEAYLLGSGAATLALLVLSVAGIRWSRFSVGLALAVVVILAAATAIRRGLPQLEWPRLGRANGLDLITAVLMAGHALLATVAAPIESDYLLIWGVKARMFFAAGGIDWAFLEMPLNVTSHPDYPLLLPLLYDFHAIVHGSWPESWTGFVTFAFGAGALLGVRGLLASEMPRLPRAVVTLILMPLLFSPYMGIAEAPLIAYATLGVLYVRRGVLAAGRGEVLVGALFLGLAAWSKNEGLSLILAVAVAMIAAGAVRLLPMLWPAVAIPLPWIILHRMHGLRVDLAESGAVDRLLMRLADPIPILEALLERTGMPLVFWAGTFAAFVFGVRRLVREERFLALATAVQLLVYVGVYFVTPRELDWHIETSWDRVLRQIMPMIALLALLSTVRFISGNARSTPVED